ncbi:MAG TPA: hypothetical protein VGC40_12965 [Paenirhodobacter sp.]
MSISQTIPLTDESSTDYTQSSEHNVLANGILSETVTIQLANDTHSYELSVAEGAGTITINGVSYTYDTADIIGKAPMILFGPRTALPLPADLSTLTSVDYVTGPYLYDPAGGAPVVTLSTRRGDEVLGAGPNYAPTDFDRISGFSAQQNVVNGWGKSAALTEIVAPHPYTPAKLSFTATHALIKSDGIQPGGADSMLIVANMMLEERSGTIYRDTLGTKLRAYFTSQSGRAYASDLNGGLLLNYNDWLKPADPFTADDNICLMLYMNTPGYAQIAYYRNGQKVRASSSTRSAATEKLDTTTVLTIGFTDFGSYKDYSVKGGYWDFRIWTDLAEVPDLGTPSVASCFMTDSGTAKHPDIANARFGTPRIWLPTMPAQANALVNQGSSGNFTSKKGTFA